MPIDLLLSPESNPESSPESNPRTAGHSGRIVVTWHPNQARINQVSSPEIRIECPCGTQSRICVICCGAGFQVPMGDDQPGAELQVSRVAGTSSLAPGSRPMPFIFLRSIQFTGSAGYSGGLTRCAPILMWTDMAQYGRNGPVPQIPVHIGPYRIKQKVSGSDWINTSQLDRVSVGNARHSGLDNSGPEDTLSASLSFISYDYRRRYL